MFQLLLGDFTNVMYAGIDAYGSLWPAVYFISFAVLMALIFTNLVIGVVCDLYLSEVYAPMLAKASSAALVDVNLNTGGEIHTVENPHLQEEQQQLKVHISDVLKENAELQLENARLIAALKMTHMKRAIPHILRKRSTAKKAK